MPTLTQETWQPETRETRQENQGAFLSPQENIQDLTQHLAEEGLSRGLTYLVNELGNRWLEAGDLPESKLQKRTQGAFNQAWQGGGSLLPDGGTGGGSSGGSGGGSSAWDPTKTNPTMGDFDRLLQTADPPQNRPRIPPNVQQVVSPEDWNKLQQQSSELPSRLLGELENLTVADEVDEKYLRSIFQEYGVEWQEPPSTKYMEYDEYEEYDETLDDPPHRQRNPRSLDPVKSVKDNDGPWRTFRKWVSDTPVGKVSRELPILDLFVPILLPTYVEPGYFDDMWGSDGTLGWSGDHNSKGMDGTPMFPSERDCKFWTNSPFCKSAIANVIDLIDLTPISLEVFTDGCQTVWAVHIGLSIAQMPGVYFGKRNPECDYEQPAQIPPSIFGPPLTTDMGLLGEIRFPPYQTNQILIGKNKEGWPFSVLGTFAGNPITAVRLNQLAIRVSWEKDGSDYRIYEDQDGNRYVYDQIVATYLIIEAEPTYTYPWRPGDTVPMGGFTVGFPSLSRELGWENYLAEVMEGRGWPFFSISIYSYTIRWVRFSGDHATYEIKHFSFPISEPDLSQFYLCPVAFALWDSHESFYESQSLPLHARTIGNLYNFSSYSEDYLNLSRLRGQTSNIERTGVCILIDGFPFIPRQPPFLPVVSPPEPPPMSCCDQTKQLLAKMGKQVKEIHARYVSDNWGEENSGISVPKELFGKEDKQVTVKTWPEFFSWFVLQFDTLIGQWPVEIEVENEEKKKQKLQIPNLAEGIAELYGLGAGTALDSDVSVAILLRMVAEIISIKSIDLSTSDYVRAIADFLNFPGKEVKRDLPLNFTIGTQKGEIYERPQDVRTVLQPSTAVTRGYEFVGDSDATLVEALKKLLYAAAITKAAHVRGGEETKPQQRRDLLGTLGDVASVVAAGASVANLVRGNGEQVPVYTWDEFIAQLKDPDSALNRGWPAPDATVTDDPTAGQGSGPQQGTSIGSQGLNQPRTGGAN